MIRPQFLIKCGFAVSPLLLCLDSERVPLRLVIAIAALVLALLAAGYLLQWQETHRQNFLRYIIERAYFAGALALALFIAWCSIPVLTVPDHEIEETL